MKQKLFILIIWVLFIPTTTQAQTASVSFIYNHSERYFTECSVFIDSVLVIDTLPNYGSMEKCLNNVRADTSVHLQMMAGNEVLADTHFTFMGDSTYAVILSGAPFAIKSRAFDLKIIKLPRVINGLKAMFLNGGPDADDMEVYRRDGSNNYVLIADSLEYGEMTPFYSWQALPDRIRINNNSQNLYTQISEDFINNIPSQHSISGSFIFITGGFIQYKYTVRGSIIHWPEFRLLAIKPCSSPPYILPDIQTYMSLLEGKSTALALYPVPAREKITIRFRQQFNIATELKISSLSGTLLKSVMVNPDELVKDIPIDDLPAGMYLLHYKSQGENDYLKFIVN